MKVGQNRDMFGGRLALLTMLLALALPGAAVEYVGKYFTLAVNQELGQWTLRPGQVWVVYGASWCLPCKQLDGNLALLLQEAAITVVYVDADQHRSMLIKNKVETLPTIAFYLDGNLLSTAQRIDLPFLKECFGLIEAERKKHQSHADTGKAGAQTP